MVQSRNKPKKGEERDPSNLIIQYLGTRWLNDMCSIRKLGLLFIIVIFSFGNLQAANDVVIWHIPHPDDETLGMGGSIYRNGQEGKRNIIVFYTGGGASGVRHLLNGRFYSSFLERRLRPEEEGYEPLTVKEFEQARIKESRAALHVLGVKDEDILEVGLKDSALTVGDVISAMEELHRLYPYAAHRTTAISDSYPDHQTNSWNCREQTVLLKRNSVHLAHVFQLYLGGGGYFAKERSLGYVVGSDFIRHFFVEYNWKGKERNWKYGFRLHY